MNKTGVNVNKGAVVNSQNELYIQNSNVFISNVNFVTSGNGHNETQKNLDEVAAMKKELDSSKRNEKLAKERITELQNNLANVLNEKRQAQCAEKEAHHELVIQRNLFDKHQMEAVAATEERNEIHSGDLHVYRIHQMELEKRLRNKEVELRHAMNTVLEYQKTQECTENDLKSAHVFSIPLQAQVQVKNQDCFLSRLSRDVRTLLHTWMPMILYAVLILLAYSIITYDPVNKFMGLVLREVFEFGMDLWVFLWERRSKRLLPNIY